MNGQYPVFATTPTAWPKHGSISLPTPGTGSSSRIFDVDNSRCVALDGIEYINYITGTTPVEVEVEKHGYDVQWFNPVNGESIEVKKYKGEHFTGEAPDKSHPWVLMIAREGRKESMLRSYKFDSRPVPVQEVETIPQKLPSSLSNRPPIRSIPSLPTPYAVKL